MEVNDMKLPNKIYDVLKWVVIIVLPAIGAAYTGLSQIWSLPYAAEIPATITVVCTFLGAVLCISTAEYNKDGHDN
jgi:branched-subunit amino acid transport protein